ncbi:MAG: hypothetical protein R3C71_13765 [Candidatus Krumholzibacteriia bacterium]
MTEGARLGLAALLAVLLAVAHSSLGERFILIRLLRRQDLPRLFGSDRFTRRTLRFAWHLSSVAWLGLAAALVLQAGEDLESARERLLLALSLTFLVSGAITALVSRGRHLAWPVFVAVALLAWPRGLDVPDANLWRERVLSWQTLPVDSLNLRIESARAAREGWATQPESIVRTLLGERLWEAPQSRFDVERTPPESPNRARVTVLLEQLPDDSVAGLCRDYTLELDATGGWVIAELREAWRCRRGADPTHYRAERCR